MLRIARDRPADRLDHLTGLATWLGWGVVVGALQSHTSQTANVGSRYSLGFGLVLVASLGVFIVLGGLLFIYWRRWPAALRRALRTLPLALWPAYLVTGAAALVWVWQFGPLWNAVAGRAGLPLGLAVIYAGVGILIYHAAATESDGAARPGLVDAGRRALAATLLAVPAWLFAAAAGLQPDSGGGLILLPGLLGLVLGAYALTSPSALTTLRRGWATGRARLRGRWPYVGAALVVAYVILVYSPGLRHALLGGDELRLLWSVYAPASFERWAAANPYSVPLIRPLFSLQAALLYRLFGLNYSAHYGAQVLVLAASCVLLFGLVWRTTRHGLLALLAGCLLASHVYVSDLVTGWGYDTGPLTGALVVGGVWLVAVARARIRSFLAVAAVLVLVPLSRENGLALPGAVAFYSVAAWLGRFQPRRRLAAWLALSGGCGGAYFAWRAIAYPGWWRQVSAFGEDTGLFFQMYSAEAVKALSAAERLQLNAYTAGANLLANFVPIFGPYGVVWAGPFTAWLTILATLLTLVLALAAGQALWPPQATAVGGQARRLAGLPVAVTALAGLLFSVAAQPAWFLAPALDLHSLQFALHAALSLGAGLALIGGVRWSRARLSLAFLSVGLILANSLITFPYFRYRSQYLGLLGWVLLIAAIVGSLRGRRWQAHLRQALLALACGLALVNGVRVYSSLPLPRLLPEHFAYARTNLLCDPDFPPDLAAAISNQYHLDAQRLAACRSAPP